MKQITLITLLGLACSSLAMAGEGFRHEYENGGHWQAIEASAAARPDDESARWSSAELLWNEEYGAYQVAFTLEPDIFQERMVWSDHYREFVPVGMAKMAEFQAYRQQLVWSDVYDGMVPRALVEPCPQLAAKEIAVRLASLQ